MTTSRSRTDARHTDVTYEPVVDLELGTVTGVEVHRTTREPVPAAELLATAAAALGERRSPHDLSLVVALGRGDLGDDALPRRLSDALGGTTADAVLVQLPTSIAARQLSRSRALVRELQATGFGVSLSAFDVGGTVELLRQLPVDALGLGAGMVRLLADDRQAELNAIAVASAAGELPVTAAGVHRLDAVRKLRAMGVHRIQGPVALEALLSPDGAGWSVA